MTRFDLRLALSFILIFWLSTALEAQGLDFRYSQSHVRDLPQEPTPFAYPVCDMLETYTGLPARLDAKHLLAAAAGKDIGLVSTFYQYMLEEKGLIRYDSLRPADVDAVDWTHYCCPKGTVLTLQDPARITSPDKIISFLQQGIRGIVVSYAYCPRDWKKGNWHLDRARTKFKAKGRHAVLIVGYQDSSFIFKNSWSARWGENGYGRMSFAYHRSHAQEGLLAYLAEAKEPATGQSEIAIKTQAEILEGEPYLQVSLVAVGPGRLPAIEALDYKLTESGKLSIHKKTLLNTVGQLNGYPCLIPLHSTDKAFDLSVEIMLQGGKNSKMVKLSRLRWENAEYALDLK